MEDYVVLKSSYAFVTNVMIVQKMRNSLVSSATREPFHKHCSKVVIVGIKCL